MRGALLAATLALAIAVASASVVMPQAASATIMQGTATESTSDAGDGGAPSQDIIRATAQYDSRGWLSASATMNGDIASGPGSYFSFNVGSYSPPKSCAGVTASLFGFSTSKEGGATLSGASGVGVSLISVSGNTITFTTYGLAYANSSFSCMQVTVTSTGEGGNILDQLSPPLWFEGFVPPTAMSTPTPSPTQTTMVGIRTAPTVSAFGAVAKVKLSSGVGTLTVSCKAPSTEACAFKLALYATVSKNGHVSSRVTVGTVSGRIAGGASGQLTLKLNAAGRKYLRRGPFRVEAKGTVTDTAGRVTQFHKRVTIKKK